MSDVYLIKGETLTAIADAIRNSGVTTSKIDPESMAEGVERVYDAGYDTGYDEGYADGEAEGGSTTVTDLTNTIWLLNNPCSLSEFDYYINFVSNNVIYKNFYCLYDEEEGINSLYYAGETNVITITAAKDGVFTNEARRTIIITGGTDVKNTNLIIWLNTNGTLQSGGSSSEDLEALGALCDWQVVIDGSSVPSVVIANYHPSYYLHCYVNYSVEGETYPIVVNPGETASYSFDGYGVMATEQINVTEVRWSANA